MDTQSTSNHLQLIELNIDSYCGIDKTDSILLVFPPDTKVTELKGDQATCKTSTLNFIKRALGAEEVPNAINSVDKDKKGYLKLKLPNGDIVTCKQTKTSFTVTLENKDGVKSTVQSPKSYLASIIGKVGLSPMDLKFKSGKEQIAWLKEMFSFTDEHKKVEQQLQSGYKAAYDERRDINRDIKKIKTFLQSTPYYRWDDDNKCFVALPAGLEMSLKYIGGFEQKQADINTRYQKLMADKSSLDTARAKVENYQSSIRANDKRIDDLQLEIERLKAENENIAQSILKGNQYISEIQSCEQELPKITEEIQNLNEAKNEYNGYQAINKNFQEYTQLEEQAIKLNAKLDAYQVEQKNLIKIITPDIEGLEVCVPANIDEPEADNREGIYYNKKSMQELSESELVALYINIKKALNAKVDIIENISSLGSAAIEAINQFIKDGGIVFYSIMDRTEKDLKISFHQKIES